MRRIHFLAIAVAFAAVSIARVAVPSGLRGQYFSGSELGGPAITAPIDAEFSSVQISRRWHFAPPAAFSAQWTGYLFVGAAGSYTFSLTADDGARLFVDRRLVIERGPGPGTYSGQIQLDPGAHAVLLQYFQLGGPYQLQWNWARDHSPLSPVPAWALSTTPRLSATTLVVRALRWLWWALAAALVAGAAVALFKRWRRRAEENSLTGESSVLDRSAPIELKPIAATLMLFGVLACLHTWPLITNPAHLSRNDNADTILNEWTMSWVAHQAVRDPAHLFDANIFYPDRRALAYSEPLIVQSALGAPLAWLGASPVLVYNLVLLAGFVLTGTAMSFVISRWTGDWMAGIAAGMLLAFNAHTLTRLPHIQAQHAEFLPLALWSLDATFRTPRWSSAIWLSIWFTLQSLASLYLLVFSAIALTVAAAARPEDWFGNRFASVASKIAAAAMFAALLLSPFLLPYWELHREGLVRSIDEVAFFAATANDYVTSPARVHQVLRTSAGAPNALFPGVTALALAAAAFLARATALRDRRARMCLAFGLVGVALSFGPIVPGYSALYSTLPLFQAIRASARFGYLALFAIAVLAGFGLAALRRLMLPRRALTHAVSIAALTLLFIESYAAPIAYQPFTAIPEIYRVPASAPGAIVVDLPFHAPDATYRNAPYMLGSTRHFKPLLNGYSGFTPPSYFAHFEQLRSFPDEKSIRALQAAGVTHVFVHFDRLDENIRQSLARFTVLQRIGAEGSIELYQLKTGANR